MYKRLATLAIVGAFVCLPLISQSSASQAPGPSVTFNERGPGPSLCGSRPEPSRITVVAQSTARVTNALGMGAQLNIDGVASATVASGETVEVQFHSGPVVITMVPDCNPSQSSKFEQLTVDVTAAPAAVPGKSAKPPRPSPKPSTSAPAARAPGAVSGRSAGPLSPDGLANVPGGTAPESGTLDSPATVVNFDGGPGKKLAGESDPADKGPIGLLAIVATVCVVGVLAGAIRAIITQRATLTELA